MDRRHFNQQTERLRSQWPRQYEAERLARIWTNFEKVSDELFTEIVDRAIDTRRAAPLVTDLVAIEAEVKDQRAKHRASGGGGGSFYGVVASAAAKAQGADPDFVKACLSHLRNYIAGKIDKKAFDEGCSCLEQMARQLSAR